MQRGTGPHSHPEGAAPMTGLMPFLHLLALSVNALALGPKPSLLFSALGCWDWDPESTFLPPPAPSWALQIEFFSSRYQRALVKIQEDCIIHLFHLEAVTRVDPRSHMGSGDSSHTPGAASAYSQQRMAPTSQLQRFPWMLVFQPHGAPPRPPRSFKGLVTLASASMSRLWPAYAVVTL